MWNELKRKLFHLSSLIYVVGLVLLPRPRYVLILLAFLLLVFVVETLRLRVPSIRRVIEKIFRPLMRAREENTYSGLFWMLVGVCVTALLVEPVAVAATAILYLIIGDAMAALVGLRIKGPCWPGQKKSVIGSAACLATCLLIGIVLLRPDYGWSGVFWGACVATGVELGVVPIDDNLTIPIASSLVLMLCYGLTPWVLTIL